MKLAVALILSFLATGASPVVDTVSGAASFKSKKFDELRTAGSVDLELVSARSILARGALSFTDLTVEDSLVAKGGCSGKGLEAESLMCYGGASIKRAKVGSVEARGGFSGESIDVAKDFTLSGGLTATHLTVHGLTSITGEAKFTDCTLGDVVCAGKKQKFKDTVVRSLRVTSGDAQPETGFGFLNWIVSFFKGAKNTHVDIYLSGTTCVEGDITFESDRGTVHLSKGATIGGQVVGGTLVND